MFEVNSIRRGMPLVTRFILSFFHRLELLNQKLRYLVLKPAFKSCGHGLIIKRNVWFVYPENIEIGNDVLINNSCFFEGGKGIKIGDWVQFAHSVSVISQNHSFDRRDIEIKKQGFSGSRVDIGDDVWLGAKVTVLPGVKIGKGAVIGANSVVTDDIPPYSVAVGVPARVIKKR